MKNSPTTPTEKSSSAPPSKIKFTQQWTVGDWLHGLWGLLWFILGITVIVLWQQSHFSTAQPVQLSNDAASFKTSEDWTALTAQVSTQQSLLEEQQRQLKQLTQSLQQRNHSNYLNLIQILQETAMLLNTADLYLRVNHNPLLALEIVKLAKQRIDASPTPLLLSVKQALNQDFTALSQITPTDSASLILQLNALQTAVIQLKTVPLTNSPSPHAASPQNTSSTTAGQRWLSALASLKGLVIIRHVPAPISSLLTPAQATLLQQNSLVLLLEARTAVLTQNQRLYTNSLTELQQQVKSYPAQAGLTAIHQTITQLMTIPMVPLIKVNLQTSINAVNQALTQATLNTMAMPTDHSSTTTTSPPISTQPTSNEPSPLKTKPDSSAVET